MPQTVTLLNGEPRALELKLQPQDGPRFRVVELPCHGNCGVEPKRRTTEGALDVGGLHDFEQGGGGGGYKYYRVP